MPGLQELRVKQPTKSEAFAVGTHKQVGLLPRVPRPGEWNRAPARLPERHLQAGGGISSPWAGKLPDVFRAMPVLLGSAPPSTEQTRGTRQATVSLVSAAFVTETSLSL